MKVAVQIIDTLNGAYQHGVIDEYVEPVHAVENALGHFGIAWGECTFDDRAEDNKSRYTGVVEGTTKVFTAIVYEIQKTN